MRTSVIILLATYVCCILAQTPPAVIPIVRLNVQQYASNDCSGDVTPVVIEGQCQTSGAGSTNIIPLPNSYLEKYVPFFNINHFRVIY